MKIEPTSSSFTELNHIRHDEDGGVAFIETLYHFLLGDNTFAQLWSKTGADSSILLSIFTSIETHLAEWNELNAVTGVSWELKEDGNGWLGLAQELEEKEFGVLSQLWDLSIASTQLQQSDAEFFAAAEQVSGDSQLFRLLHSMEVSRANGTIKKVWSHVENVVTHLHSEEATVFESRTASERQAILRFTAFVHDLFNVVAIDNDWLQLHAHGGAALLYRFFVVKMGFEPTEAASLARVVDLHHLLQLQKIGDVDQRDRVIEPAEVAGFFARMQNGLEELGRLIQFSLADVGRQPGQFRSEHIAAALALLRQFVEVDSSHDEEKKLHLAQQTIEQAAQAIAYLEMQASATAEKAPFFQQLAEEIERAIVELQKFFGALVSCPHAMFADPTTQNTHT